MVFARVTGTVVCTLKDEKLVGTKLMLVQPVDSAGSAKGNPLVAVDA
ncbi:MAG: EutN/CcmL family microcompartment protein, partial [Elusimicrobia bacterium]|nr:EutN/CcmL family microcompartment protein [Elusimicrobiota bacterium]